MMNRRQTIALLGGTFDPVHRAHIQLARRALRDLPVNSVRLVPNGAPPHRLQPQTAWRARVQLCANALANISRATVGKEESPGTIRYTIDTVRHHRRRRRAIILIMGADAFADFHHWRQWRQVLQLTNIAVARRGDNCRPAAAVRARMRCVNTPNHLLGDGGGRVLAWRFRPAALSATMIRRRRAAGDR